MLSHIPLCDLPLFGGKSSLLISYNSLYHTSRESQPIFYRESLLFFCVILSLLFSYLYLSSRFCPPSIRQGSSKKCPHHRYGGTFFHFIKGGEKSRINFIGRYYVIFILIFVRKNAAVTQHPEKKRSALLSRRFCWKTPCAGTFQNHPRGSCQAAAPP